MTCEHVTEKQLKRFLRLVYGVLALTALALVALAGVTGWIVWRLVDMFEFIRVV